MLISKLLFPTLVSDSSVKVYSESRPYSYGSYLAKYREVYGNDTTDIEHRIAAGIDSGWPADCSAPIGAVRWYHRADTGANPQLAELYVEIIDKFIH